MKRFNLLLALICLAFSLDTDAQLLLSLDSCRALAMENNKDLKIADEKIKAAKFEKKAAFTKFFPAIAANGAYMYSQKELSLLNADQKLAIGNIGQKPAQAISNAMTQLVQQHPELMQYLAPLAGMDIAGPLNEVGDAIVEAFRTDTRNVFGAAITLTQPIFTGGKIIAYNKITKYAEQLAALQHDTSMRDVILSIDQAYWQVISLSYKRQLAEGYLNLLNKMNDDVGRMIAEGVATQADGLSVKVKQNEAEMALTQVDDGLTLSRMALCQLCGLDLDTDLQLVDEFKQGQVEATDKPEFDVDEAVANRPEIKSLQLAGDISRQQVNLARAEFLPTLAVTGGYMMTNPSLFNGFENRVRGMWSVGAVVSIPLCNWGGGIYKMKAAKSKALIAEYTLDDAREKIRLQIAQASFKVDESAKKLETAKKNLENADENLRYATIGFNEGVIPASNTLEAQAAWLKANSEYVDAQIEVKMNDLYLNKAIGTLIK